MGRAVAVAAAVVALVVTAAWLRGGGGERAWEAAGGAPAEVLTFVDDPSKGGFCLLVRSAEGMGVSVRVLGLSTRRGGSGATEKGRQHFLGSKLAAVASALGRMERDRLVLFVDAMDVVFQRTLDEVVAAYREAAEPGTVLFAGESSAFPLWAYERYPPPAEGDVHRFLNAGAWIGPAGEAGDMMRAAMEERAGEPDWDGLRVSPGSPAHLHRDDQAALQLVFLEGRFRAAVDTRLRVFLCLHHALYKVRVSDDGLVRHTSSAAAPAVVHFNGEAKRSGILPISEAVARMPWFSSVTPPFAARLLRLDSPPSRRPAATWAVERACNVTGLVRFS